MKPIHRFLIVAGAAGIGLWAFAFLAHSFSDAAPDRGAHSFSTDRRGHAALAELAEKVGLRAVRWRGLPGAAPEGAYALIEPFHDALDECPAECAALEERVRAGGTLLVVRPRSGERAAVLDRVGNPPPEGEGEMRQPAWEPARVGVWTAPYREHLSFSGPVLAEGDRGLEMLLNRPKYLVLQPGWKPLLAAPGGVLAAERPLGRGRVIAVSEARIFANRHLGMGGHSVAAVRLLAWAAGSPSGSVVIDEFFHDLYLRPNLARLALSWPGLAVTAPALAALALWLGSRAARLGPVRRPAERSRRRRDDLLDAMSLVLSRGGRHAEVLDRFRRGLAADLRAALRLPARASPDQVAAALAAARGPEGAAAAALICAPSARPVSDGRGLLAECSRLDLLARAAAGPARPRLLR